LVKSAQMAKPAIQKLGDKVSAWFVPAVVLIAVITFIAGHFIFDLSASNALMNGIAVLVISCPCAMGLATPTAVAVGLGKAARNGILIKGGDTLELFDGVKTVALDKTGTITTGKFRVASMQVMPEFDRSTAINTLLSLEQHSEHPLAKSIVSSLSPQATGWVAFRDVEEIKGSGLTATDEKGNTWRLGSYKSQEDLLPEPGHTVYLSMNGKNVAYLDLADDIREGAVELVQELEEMGIEVVLLSGDNEKRCREVAEATGIKTVYSSMLPDQKTAKIMELKKHGKVIMAGDGINDAPSLTAADIGISFGQATRIAMNSAQVIITDTRDLRRIATAIRLGKKTLKTIRQNLFWAFFYNVVAIPVAAIGMLSPMIAALSMAFSDVIVIGNSLRLKLFRN
jgi:P-type Cu+ transporter